MGANDSEGWKEIGHKKTRKSTNLRQRLRLGTQKEAKGWKIARRTRRTTQKIPKVGKRLATPEPTAKEAGAESDGSEAAKNTKEHQPSPKATAWHAKRFQGLEIIKTGRWRDFTEATAIRDRCLFSVEQTLLSVHSSEDRQECLSHDTVLFWLMGSYCRGSVAVGIFDGRRIKESV
jgi:hypothetical protein